MLRINTPGSYHINVAAKLSTLAGIISVEQCRESTLVGNLA